MATVLDLLVIPVVLAGVLAVWACEPGSEQRAREVGAEVQREAGVLAGKTRDGAGELMTAAGERTAEAAVAAGAWAGELVRSGQLSEVARDWLQRGAQASRGGIEALLQRGEQALPVALEIGQALAGAIDSNTRIEPIYQEVSGASPELAARRAEADALIETMPRVEVIDKLQVGFKDLSSLDTRRQTSEQAYLVVWRQDDHLIGFIYRSRRSIDLVTLVGLAPRLIGLVRSAL
ncbi:MAG: hypothetical protein H0T76_16090 [Nannocystis sp.]|nr:hypothetical protein [Nannocystis sp.]